MSGRCWALVAVSVSAVAALADPGRLPTPHGTDRTVDVLAEWARAEEATYECRVRYILTDEDPQFAQKTTTFGELRCRRGEWLRIDRGPQADKLLPFLVCRKRTIWLFDHERRRVVSLDLPPFLDLGPTGWLLLGHPLSHLARCCQARLNREDSTGLYLTFVPRDARERASWGRIHVVLERRSFRLRQFRIEQPTGTIATWELEWLTPLHGAPKDMIEAGLPQGYEGVRLTP
jgi:hypothetical protein